MQIWEYEGIDTLIKNSNGYWDEATAETLAQQHDMDVQTIAECTMTWLQTNT